MRLISDAFLSISKILTNRGIAWVDQREKISHNDESGDDVGLRHVVCTRCDDRNLPVIP